MGQEQSTDQGNQIPGGFDSDIANRNNRSNQKNPNNEVYWTSRHYDGRPDDWEDQKYVRLPRGNDNNRSRQLNPQDPLYLRSRGQNVEQLDGTYEQVETQEDTSSTMDNVMWWMKTAGQAYLAYEVGRQVYNNLTAEAQQQQEEMPPRQPRND